MDEELKELYEEQAQKKSNEAKTLRAQNLHLENYDKKMEQLLNEKVKEFKQKETDEINRIKEEHNIKVKAFKDKYKSLEDNEFAHFETEYNKNKEKFEAEFKVRMNNLENKLNVNEERLAKQEQDYMKRLELLEEKRHSFNVEWRKLSDEEAKLDEMRAQLVESKALLNSSSNKSLDGSQNETLKRRYEIEKLKLEKADMSVKLQNMQLLLDKYSVQQTMSNTNKFDVSKFLNDEQQIMDIQATDNNKKIYNNDNNNNSEMSDLNESEKKRISKFFEDEDEEEEEEENDDQELDEQEDMKELVKHAKLKLKLKYMNERKKAEIETSNSNRTSIIIWQSSDASDEDTSEADAATKNLSGGNLDEKDKRAFIESLNREKDSLKMANELLDRYKQTLAKRRLKLETAQTELRLDEQTIEHRLSAGAEKNKQRSALEDRRLAVEKDAIDIEQLGLNLKVAKRLIKQKNVQLNFLEENLAHREYRVADKEAGNDTDSWSLTDNEEENKNQATRNKLASNLLNINAKLNSIDSSLALFQTNTTNDGLNEFLTGLSTQEIRPILRKLSKLNKKLEKTLVNLAQSAESLNHAASAATTLTSKSSRYDENFINEKWNKYLGGADVSLRAVISYGINQQRTGIVAPLAVAKNAWESSPAYHRLTLDSGTRALDEKYNQYMFAGNSTIGRRVGNGSGGCTNTLKLNKRMAAMPGSASLGVNTGSTLTLATSLNGKVFGLGPVSLPESTQYRLNQHRDWLKKFKADLDFNRNEAN